MERQVKKSNLCAQIGVLLTLLNLVISSALIITGSAVSLLAFSSATAVLSLILSSTGTAVSKKLEGRGRIFGITGIVANIFILVTLAVYCGVTVF